MAKLQTLDYHCLQNDLNEQGYAIVPNVLSATDCRQTINIYQKPERFRSKIVMARHSFGQGEYQYLDYPLPPLVSTLRDAFYSHLAPVANDWARKLRLQTSYPDELSEFLSLCHGKGQKRPTPLMLKYGTGDYNRLHQDLYGDIAFPLQLAVCLSAEEDFKGGEFILTEQRPRMQTRAEVISLAQGDGIVFANRYRPVGSARGYARVNVRHGVSRIRSGERYCLGVIFHDAA